MLWMINCTDKPGHEAKRAQHLPEHRRYLESYAPQIFFSGPQMDDTGERMIGSLFIINASSRQDAESFVGGETLNQAGVFESVMVTRLRKGRFLPDLVDAA
ncbi:YciI family protein [Candidimonas sp. SYP-B2681]|uniref:YciI family protein n=1 Tax=Candidimonas sp. SYP-B2681 TaxID=2497686 RepID=UPI000F878241|nr:YciI family protein [Candidimonas sp. SYP-B2681]RTZ45462.1 YciI family protein [Candidimonas sp. SYP-B2681]